MQPKSRIDKVWERIFKIPSSPPYKQPTPHNIVEKNMIQRLGDFVKSKISTKEVPFKRWCMSSSTPFCDNASKFRYGHNMDVEYIKTDQLTEARQPNSKSINNIKRR